MPNIAPEPMNETKIVHVSVAVIQRAEQFLISKRPDHVHQGGLWEFPGGKVEDNETIETALYREIDEELGIKVKQSRPLIKLLYHYPDKSVLLETRLVTDFDGQEYNNDKIAKGCEGQEVRWIERGQLKHYSFPAANQAIINSLLLPESYAITPDDFDMEGDFAKQEAQFFKQFSALVQKHSLIQLRIKSLQNDWLTPLIRKACRIAQDNHCQILLNSAMLVDDELMQLASGVHLIGDHLHSESFVEHLRKRFPEKIIAASCHSEDDIHQANELKLNFIVLSPVQSTASHPEQVPMGWTQFETLTASSMIPVYALGGMTNSDIIQAQKQGGQGIAAIRSLWNTV